MDKTTPSPTAPASSTDDCHKSAMAALGRALEGVIINGGELAFDAFKATWNGFIEVLEASAQAVVDVIKPLFTIDEFIFNNFINPAMQAASTLAQTLQKTITIPAQTMGATNNACSQGSQNQSAVTKIANWYTQDLNSLENKSQRLQHFFNGIKSDLDSLQNLPTYVERMKITTDYPNALTWIKGLL